MMHKCLNHISDCAISNICCHSHVGSVVRREDEEHKSVSIRPLQCDCIVEQAAPKPLNPILEISQIVSREAKKEFSYLASWSLEARVGARLSQAIRDFNAGYIEVKDGKLVLTKAGKQAQK